MYSVFQPTFPVFKLPQSKEQNVMVEVFLVLVLLKTQIFNVDAPLRIVKVRGPRKKHATVAVLQKQTAGAAARSSETGCNPSHQLMVGENADEEPAPNDMPVDDIMRPVQELQPNTTTLRAKLYRELEERFFQVYALKPKGNQQRCYDTDLLMMMYPPFATHMTYVYTFCDIKHPKNGNQIFLDGNHIIEGTRREMLRRMEIVETSKRAERAEKESKRSPSINAHDKLMHPTGIYIHIHVHMYTRMRACVKTD